MTIRETIHPELDEELLFPIPFLGAFDGEGDDDGDDEGGDDDGPNLDDPAIRAAIASQVDQETAGLRSNRDELKAEKKALSRKLRELEQRFDGLDPDKVRALMQRFENDEEAQLIADGKVDEVIERRTKRALEQAESDVTAARTRAEELEQSESTLKARIKRLILDRAVQEVALSDEVGLLPSAVTDAIERAHRVFQVNDEDELVAMEGDTIIRGKDGKSPLTIGEWLLGMRKSAPHWWAPSTGGGANGSGDGDPHDDKDRKAQVDKMSSRDKLRTGLQAQADS